MGRWPGASLSADQMRATDPVLAPQFEIVRDRAFPVNGSEAVKAAWLVYIDNLDEGEIFEDTMQAEVEGIASASIDASDARYEEWASPGSDDKAVNRAPDVTSLGTRTHGVKGRRDVPVGYLPKVIACTLWTLAQKKVSRKMLQVVAGRWVRVFLRRRCLFVSFDHLRRWIARPRPARAVLEKVAVERLN